MHVSGVNEMELIACMTKHFCMTHRFIILSESAEIFFAVCGATEVCHSALGKLFNQDCEQRDT